MVPYQHILVCGCRAGQCHQSGQTAWYLKPKQMRTANHRYLQIPTTAHALLSTFTPEIGCTHPDQPGQLLVEGSSLHPTQPSLYRWPCCLSTVPPFLQSCTIRGHCVPDDVSQVQLGTGARPCFEAPADHLPGVLQSLHRAQLALCHGNGEKGGNGLWRKVRRLPAGSACVRIRWLDRYLAKGQGALNAPEAPTDSHGSGIAMCSSQIA